MTSLDRAWLETLLGGSVLLALSFVVSFGAPWRNERPLMAWLQVGLALIAAAVDTMIFLSVLGLHVPIALFLAILLIQDGIFGLRLFVLYQRRTGKG